jgi:hypothetical protein
MVPSQRQYITAAAVGSVLLVWLAATWIFWLGYVGTDDIFYARYAHLFHRPPINWWEFRIPAILAIRASFLLLGPTELAAALPNLLASLAILASVAWFVGWPKRLTWQTQAAVLIAATIPLDVNYRSVPGANHLSAGLLALGTAALLKGGRRVQLLGSALLALGFMTHELSFFYVAIVCVTVFALDRKRYALPVAACIAISAGALILESAVYYVLLGDPFARYKVSAGSTTNLPTGYDPDLGIGGLAFFLWPLRLVVFSKTFGFDLLLLITTGVLAWKHLTKEQRILYAATVAVWAWLGYGTFVPWAYKPLYRQAHYYTCLVFGVAALLPVTLGWVFQQSRRVAQCAVAGVLVIHVVCCASGGGWGQDVDVARGLLAYATEHRKQVFLTDVKTMNYMYALGGFQLPKNVICLNGPAVENNLRVNKEPPGTPRFRFPERLVSAVLLNNETMRNGGAEAPFTNYVKLHAGKRVTVVPTEYRLLVRPLAPLVGPRPFFVRSNGGAVAAVISPASPSAENRGSPPAWGR